MDDWFVWKIEYGCGSKRCTPNGTLAISWLPNFDPYPYDIGAKIPIDAIPYALELLVFHSDSPNQYLASGIWFVTGIEQGQLLP